MNNNKDNIRISAHVKRETLINSTQYYDIDSALEISKNKFEFIPNQQEEEQEEEQEQEQE